MPFGIFFLLTYVFGAQKNRLIETVLLRTHNICLGLEIRKIDFSYALLTVGLLLSHVIAPGSDKTTRKYSAYSGL